MPSGRFVNVCLLRRHTYLIQAIVSGSCSQVPRSPIPVQCHLSQLALCADLPDTYENLYAFFIDRVRDRLHVILCFSPVGATFARRAQQVCDADCIDACSARCCGRAMHAAVCILALHGLAAIALC